MRLYWVITLKKIKFLAVHKEIDVLPPTPASKHIPSWFRQIDGVINGIETVKKCMPFLDAMMSGYTISLPADVYFDSERVTHNSHIDLVSTHDKSQLDGLELPAEYKDQPFKWNNSFVAKTPKGYSTLFIHPINRIDLPFFSLAGVVETDKFPVAVNFPFFVKKDFEGIIEAGTPIIQAIPFKREDWKMDLDEIKNGQIPIDFFNSRLNPPFNYYKRKFWVRKKYI